MTPEEYDRPLTPEDVDRIDARLQSVAKLQPGMYVTGDDLIEEDLPKLIREIRRLQRLADT